MSRTISFELSTSSINHAIREVERYQKDLRKCCEELMRILIDDGVTIAKMNVMSMNAVQTGELENDIAGVYFPSERLGVVYSPSPHALFVEYGTGVVGENSPHPEPGKIGWEYDIHGHGDSGWVYYATIDGVSGFRWTKGMVSRPFMYNTLRWLEANAAGEASNVFSTL